jgi:hypothetical protein
MNSSGHSELLFCHAEPFGNLRIDSVKHLLWFVHSSDQVIKVKSRFFVAALLRMTHRSRAGCYTSS